MGGMSLLQHVFGKPPTNHIIQGEVVIRAKLLLLWVKLPLLRLPKPKCPPCQYCSRTRNRWAPCLSWSRFQHETVLVLGNILGAWLGSEFGSLGMLPTFLDALGKKLDKTDEMYDAHLYLRGGILVFSFRKQTSQVGFTYPWAGGDLVNLRKSWLVMVLIGPLSSLSNSEMFE